MKKPNRHTSFLQFWQWKEETLSSTLWGFLTRPNYVYMSFLVSVTTNLTKWEVQGFLCSVANPGFHRTLVSSIFFQFSKNSGNWNNYLKGRNFSCITLNPPVYVRSTTLYVILTDLTGTKVLGFHRNILEWNCYQLEFVVFDCNKAASRKMINFRQK